MGAQSPFWSKRRSAVRVGGTSSAQAAEEAARQGGKHGKPGTAPARGRRQSAEQRRSGVVLRALSDEEKDARFKALQDSRVARCGWSAKACQRDDAERREVTDVASASASSKRRRNVKRRKKSAATPIGRGPPQGRRDRAASTSPTKPAEEEEAPRTADARHKKERQLSAPRRERGAPLPRQAHHHQCPRRGAAPAQPRFAEAPPRAAEEADFGAARRSRRFSAKSSFPKPSPSRSSPTAWPSAASMSSSS